MPLLQISSSAGLENGGMDSTIKRIKSPVVVTWPQTKRLNNVPSGARSELHET
jgi:hypothetical protein